MIGIMVWIQEFLTPFYDSTHKSDLVFVLCPFQQAGPYGDGSLRVEEPVHTRWCCTVNHRASASNYQLSSIKRAGGDSNR